MAPCDLHHVPPHFKIRIHQPSENIFFLDKLFVPCNILRTTGFWNFVRSYTNYFSSRSYRKMAPCVLHHVPPHFKIRIHQPSEKICFLDKLFVPCNILRNTGFRNFVRSYTNYYRNIMAIYLRLGFAVGLVWCIDLGLTSKESQPLSVSC